MYNCKYCGYMSDDMSINSCQNPDCSNYGKKDSVIKSFGMPDDMHQLAYATVPNQKMNMVFKPNEVLKAGTIFPELYMPYTYKIVNRG